AEALGVENEIGTLEAGKRADLIAVDLSGSRHQPVIEPETALAFTASGGDVVLTVVDGQVLYTDGKVQTLDEVELARQVVATTKRLREK
ncbi:MAG: amidohydrolase family protein, partial [Planctomycetes bacterium]|nr:amidohydrolase family protein [Planctomycetota bacterium]